MGVEEDIVERLDRIVSLLSIAHADRVDTIKDALREDPVQAKILDVAKQDWVAAGELIASVIKDAKVSERTVQRAITSLESRSFLDSKGAGRSTSYRSAWIMR
jgi:hypothetical protein